MSFLIGRWVVEDAGAGSIMRGPSVVKDGHRVGQAVLELRERHSSEVPFGWFHVTDSRSVGYKLELDAEKPRMRTLIFAQTFPMAAEEARKRNLRSTEWAAVSSRDAILGLRHENHETVLVEGYEKNPSVKLAYEYWKTVP